VALAFSPDGRTLLTSDYSGGALYLWDRASGRLLRSWYAQATPGFIEAGAFSPDGKRIASGGILGNRLARVWDAATGELLFRLPAGNVYGLAFTPDGEALITVGSQMGDIGYWDLALGGHLRCIRAGDGFYPCKSALSGDGQTLFTSDFNGPEVRAWEVRTGKERLRLRGGDATRIWSLAVSPDGRTLATGGWEGGLLLWDVPAVAAARPVRLPDFQPETLWHALAEKDARAAYRSHWLLMEAPEQAVALLGERLHPAQFPPVDLMALVERLGAEDFSEREKATARLLELGDQARLALQEAAEGHDSAEVRRRAREILARAADVLPSGEQLCALRAIETLEQIGSPAAAKVLERLASGVALARQTREAAAALARLRKAERGR
jgi:hypothetical protein